MDYANGGFGKLDSRNFGNTDYFTSGNHSAQKGMFGTYQFGTQQANTIPAYSTTQSPSHQMMYPSAAPQITPVSAQHSPQYAMHNYGLGHMIKHNLIGIKQDSGYRNIASAAAKQQQNDMAIEGIKNDALGLAAGIGSFLLPGIAAPLAVGLGAMAVIDEAEDNYRLTNRVNNLTGRIRSDSGYFGLSGEQNADIGRFIKSESAKDVMIDSDEYESILSAGADSGLMASTGSAQMFKDKARELTGKVKQLMDSLGSSDVKGLISAMSEFQQIGFGSVSGMGDAVLSNATAAQFAGVTSDTMMDMTKSAVMNADATGIDRRLGALSVWSSAAEMGIMQQSGRMGANMNDTGTFMSAAAGSTNIVRGFNSMMGMGIDMNLKTIYADEIAKENGTNINDELRDLLQKPISEQAVLVQEKMQKSPKLISAMLNKNNAAAFVRNIKGLDLPEVEGLEAASAIELASTIAGPGKSAEEVLSIITTLDGGKKYGQTPEAVQHLLEKINIYQNEGRKGLTRGTKVAEWKKKIDTGFTARATEKEKNTPYSHVSVAISEMWDSISSTFGYDSAAESMNESNSHYSSLYKSEQNNRRNFSKAFSALKIKKADEGKILRQLSGSVEILGFEADEIRTKLEAQDVVGIEDIMDKIAPNGEVNKALAVDELILRNIGVARSKVDINGSERSIIHGASAKDVAWKESPSDRLRKGFFYTISHMDEFRESKHIDEYSSRAAYRMLADAYTPGGITKEGQEKSNLISKRMKDHRKTEEPLDHNAIARVADRYNLSPGKTTRLIKNIKSGNIRAVISTSASSKMSNIDAETLIEATATEKKKLTNSDRDHIPVEMNEIKVMRIMATKTGDKKLIYETISDMKEGKIDKVERTIDKLGIKGKGREDILVEAYAVRGEKSKDGIFKTSKLDKSGIDAGVIADISSRKGNSKVQEALLVDVIASGSMSGINYLLDEESNTPYTEDDKEKLKLMTKTAGKKKLNKEEKIEAKAASDNLVSTMVMEIQEGTLDRLPAYISERQADEIILTLPKDLQTKFRSQQHLNQQAGNSIHDTKGTTKLEKQLDNHKGVLLSVKESYVDMASKDISSKTVKKLVGIASKDISREAKSSAIRNTLDKGTDRKGRSLKLTSVEKAETMGLLLEASDNIDGTKIENISMGKIGKIVTKEAKKQRLAEAKHDMKITGAPTLEIGAKAATAIDKRDIKAYSDLQQQYPEMVGMFEAIDAEKISILSGGVKGSDTPSVGALYNAAGGDSELTQAAMLQALLNIEGSMKQLAGN